MHAHRPAALAQADRRNQTAEAGAHDLRMAGLHDSARQRHAFDLAAVAEPKLHRPGGACGRVDQEKFTIDRSISAMCEMSASTTCTRTTRSSDEPADSMCRMFDNVMRTCSAIGPWLRSPVCGSTGTMPDKKM